MKGMLWLPISLLTLCPMLRAAEPSLVPDAPSTAPDYFCTWNVQGFACSYSGPSKRLVVNEQEAGIIRQVVDIYLRENIGLKGLARRIQQMGMSSRRGARWCHTTIRAILMNSMFVGKVQFLRRQMKLNRGTGRRVPKFRDDAEVIAYDDPALRILDDATFQKVQGTITERGNGQSTTPRLPRQVRAFTGLAFCVCGSPCYTCKSQNSKGTYFIM
jgi:hypothetical protein